MGAPAPAKSPVKSRAATKVRTAASPARSPSRPKRGVQRLSVLGASGHSRRRTPVRKLTNVLYLYIIASLSGHVSVSRYAEQEGKFILTDGLSRVTVALSTVTSLCATMAQIYISCACGRRAAIEAWDSGSSGVVCTARITAAQ